MRGLIFLGFLVFCLGNAGAASADLLFAQNNILQSDQKPRIGNQQAVSKAKKTYPGNEILSVKLLDSKGPPVYRIKMIKQGVVKLVYVDGINGEVFE